MAQIKPIITAGVRNVKVARMTLQEIIEAYTPESLKRILADHETKGTA